MACEPRFAVECSHCLVAAQQVEWDKHPSLHPGEEKQRQETRNYDERRIENRGTHLLGSFVDHLHNRFAVGLWQVSVLAQPFVDIFHIHYGVIDERTYCYGYTSEAHGVDTHVHQPQDYDCDDD